MKTVIAIFLLISSSQSLFSQSLKDSFSIKKMKQDLQVYKNIRTKANSGLYKYRTETEIDSIYSWADMEVNKSKTYRDFYNIICQLTDFEGSVHNYNELPKKIYAALKNEGSGYCPLQIKQIGNKMIMNIKGKDIPLGSEIISINGEPIDSICKNLYKYYTTDGVNTTGKYIGINGSFAKYYRLHYGLKEEFVITYKKHNEQVMKSTTLKSIGYAAYNTNFGNRYSKPFDDLDYINYDKLKDKYSYEKIDANTGILTINTFVIGWNEKDANHKIYVKYLDSIFTIIKKEKIKNIIVDVRHNGGGTDPNDLVSYTYFAQKEFSENKEAWVSFRKIPYMKYIDTKVPRFLRFLGVIKYNLYFKQEFPIEKNGRFYEGDQSDDHKIRTPKKNVFTGNIYLMISPRIASAGSLFASMVAGNSNTIVIGEETMGGYYGHNGHIPMTYILPESKLKTTFSIVNLKQYVPEKKNQIHGRGIIPDYKVVQTYADFLTHTDTQMNFVLDLIKKNKR